MRIFLCYGSILIIINGRSADKTVTGYYFKRRKQRGGETENKNFGINI
jgi:hypothetical protein